MVNILKNFKFCVEENPNKVAIFDDDTEITYQQLDKITSLFANRLSTYNITSNKVIPLLISPSKETIITIITLYKLGLAYTPISIQFPNSRIEGLIEDSEANILISDQDIVLKNNVNIINLNEELKIVYDNLKSKAICLNIDVELADSDLAYIIYTSGSTGKPKGVKITHGNLNNLLLNMQQYYPVKQGDKYILSTPYTFDVSVAEIFSCIVGGGSLYITNAESGNDLKNLFQKVVKHEITHMALSPAVLNMILSMSEDKTIEEVNQTLKYLMIAGEEFKPALANKVLKLMPNVYVDNLYGPTENTVYSTRYRLNNQNYIHHVPIGKALNGVETYILNDKLKKCEVDEIGELYLAGNNLSEGYYNNDIKTSESFIYITGKKLYKTGDLCKYDSEANIVFIKRNDKQIQINGIRVELEEIENILLNNSKIDGCKILYYENNLICFYTMSEAFYTNTIKDNAKSLLPSYMVPHYFIRIEKFPLNVNRKIDKQKLISIFNDKFKSINKEDLSNIEYKLREIFSEVCNRELDYISKNDHFFDKLGADSLKNISCIIRIEKEFNVQLDDGFIYRNPTIVSIAEKIEEKQTKSQSSISQQTHIPLEKANFIINQYFKNVSQEIKYNKLMTTEKTYYLQKVYFHDEFNSIVTFNIQYPKTYGTSDIITSINTLIKNNEMLRSVLTKDDNELFFKTYEDVVLPIYNLNLPMDYYSDDYNSAKEKIINILENEITQSVLNNLLYRVVIIENNDNQELILLMSHHISDYSNFHIIKKQLFNPFKPSQNYFDFIKTLDSNSEILTAENYFLNDDLNKIGKQQLEINKDKNKEFLILKYEVSKIESLENEEIISYINYLLTQMMCEVLDNEMISISSILNERQFSYNDFTNNIGDFHFSITTVGKINESYQDFKSRMTCIVNDYKKGFNIMNVIFKNYPNMNKTQKHLEELYDLNPSLKTNYLGKIREEEIEDLVKSLKLTKVQLNKFPVDKLYVTFFTTDKYVYITFLTNPQLNEDVIQRYEFIKD